MKNVILKSLAVLLSVVIVFCCLTEPLSVSASDTPDLTLVESDYTASEVAELIAGVDDAVLVVILIITGFIALTYVTLRNVEAPIEFSSTDSFYDKCEALGQYMLDNIDDNVKDIFYSIYEFVTAGSITSISSVPKLNLTTVGTFFAKIGAWLGGSLVSSINTVSQGLLDLFGTDFLSSLPQYSYYSEFVTLFNQYSSIPFDNTVGIFSKYTVYSCDSFSLNTGCVLVVYSSSSYLSIKPYILSSDGSTLTYTSFNSHYTGSFDYSNATGSGDVAPNLSSYSTVNWRSSSSNEIVLDIGSGYYFITSAILNYLFSFGVNLYSTSVSSNTLTIDQVNLVSSGTATTTTSSDTVTVPLSDELVLEIANIAAAAAAGTIATTKDYYDELIAGLALTITSALSGSNFTNPEGDYYIPSLDNIWKYVEYMFSTLGSWIIFAGKCIQCVTVGEGGLSWIFYGGFIFLICGGIVGKILLG